MRPTPLFAYGDCVATPAEDTGHVLATRRTDGGFVYQVVPERPTGRARWWAEDELTRLHPTAATRKVA